MSIYATVDMSCFMRMWLTSCLLSISLANAFAAEPPTRPSQITIESPSEIVETYVAKPVRQTVILQNASDESVKLLDVKSANKLVEITAFEPQTTSVAARSSKEISLEFVSRLMLGAHRIPFDCYTLSDSGNAATVRGFARAFVQNAFEPDRPEIDFGIVAREAHVTKSIRLTSQEITGIELARVAEAPKFLSVRVIDNGAGLSATSGDDVPWGISQGFIKVLTNSQVQPEVWVHYQLDMRGEVVPSQNPVTFAPDNAGGEQETTVRLTRADGKPLSILSTSTSGVNLTTRIDDCTPARTDCKLLRVVLPADAPSGLITGAVTVKFEGLKNELPIQVGGFRLAKGQKFKSLTDASATQASGSMTPAEPVDVGKAISRANRVAAPRPAPDGHGPLLKWSVEHESTIYGYAVYRSDSDAGPFMRVNQATIRSHDDEDESTDYQWRDNSAETGKTYWYYIGVIQNDGHKRKLSDPQRVVAK